MIVTIDVCLFGCFVWVVCACTRLRACLLIDLFTGFVDGVSILCCWCVGFCGLASGAVALWACLLGCVGFGGDRLHLLRVGCGVLTGLRCCVLWWLSLLCLNWFGDSCFFGACGRWCGILF